MIPSLIKHKNGTRQEIALKSTSGLSLLVANSSKSLNSPILVVCNRANDAVRIVEEIRFFNSELRVHQFPDWETLPYDVFSPHQDLISERLETLFEITTNNVDVLVVPITTALHKLPPPAFLHSYVFFLKVKEILDPSLFREKLQLANYSAVSQVVSPGEYAIKGGIIDVFPMGSVLPLSLIHI